MNKKIASSIALLLLFAVLLCGCCAAGKTPGVSPSPQATPSAQDQASPQTGAAAGTANPESYALVEPESPETPAPTVQSDAGEMPETQPFMNYTSTTGGYDVQVPENWTASAKGENIKFTRGYNGIQVEIVKTTEPFTLDAVKGVHVANLVKKGRAIDVKSVGMEETKSGQAVYVEYVSNSEPLDGKKVRLMNHRYYFHKNGTLAVLTMWAPLGVDDENIWKQIPDTFFWR